MNPIQSNAPSARLARQTGFSLIELMVAMVLGLIVAAGIITLFSSTSRANRTQAQLARMQEQGRFVINRMVGDLRMTLGQYCSNSGGVPSNGDNPSAVVWLDQARIPTMFAKTLSLPANTASVSLPNEPYPLPVSYYMRGYECDASSCTPTAPTAAQGIPAIGTTAGKRIKGTDILTVRYLRGNGWAMDGSSSKVNVSGGGVSGVTLSPKTGEQPASYIQNGDLLMLAECNHSQVFAVDSSLGWSTSGNVTTAKATPPGAAMSNDVRLYDFSRDFVTVTYFIELKADDNPDAATGHLVGVLMRKVNDGAAEELVRGVERMDFRYGVRDKLGRQVYLTADEVDNRAGNSVDCPAGSKDAPAAWKDASGQETGCLWRAVTTIEVNLLLDSVDYGGMPDAELAYKYPPDGNAIQTPPTTMVNGLSRDMMRRSFTAVVSVRNNTF